MTRRWAAPLALLAALAAAAPARGQAPRDSVTYTDAKDGKLVTAADTTVRKESAAGIEILVGKDVKLVPAPDIVRVEYGGLPGLTVADLAVARQLEDADDLVKAQARYADLLKRAGPASPKTKRFLAFREVMTAAKLADQKAKPDEFKAEAERVVKQLAEFAQANDKGWEVWPATRAAARMQMELGDFAAAAATLGKLAQNPDLTPDLKYAVKLDEAEAKLRAGGGGLDAGAALGTLEADPKFPASGPLRQKLAVLKVAAKLPAPAAGDAPAKPAEAVAALEKAIAEATDPAARATGYGLLGDLLRAHGQTRDAMWAYLWVDVVYPQDRDARVVALHRLAAAFEAMGDAERAAQFRDKLPAAR